MIYILIWLLVLGLSIFLFKKSSGSLSLLQPNMLSIIFYYSLLISGYIGSLFIVLGIDDYYMLRKLTHEHYRVIGFAVMCFVMIFLPLTMWLVSKLTGFNAQREYQSYLKRDIEIFSFEKREFFWIFLGFSLLSLGAIGYVILKTPHIPIFDLVLNQSGLSAGQLRIEAQRNFQGNYLIKNIFAVALTPLLSFIAYTYAVHTKERRWKILFVALFIGAVFINVYDLAKSPIFFYLIMFLLLRLYVGKLSFSVPKLILWGSLGAGVLITMYVVIQGVSDLASFFAYNKGPMGRLLLAQISPMYLHLNHFTETLPMLDGQGLPSLILNLFDESQVRSGRLLMTHLFPDKVAAGTAGVLNTLYVGEAYANFGYLGILFGTLYIGVYVQAMYIIFIRLPKHPVFLSLFIFFSVNIPRTIVGGFSDFIFNPIWVLVVVLFGGILLFLRLKKDSVDFIQNKRVRS